MHRNEFAVSAGPPAKRAWRLALFCGAMLLLFPPELRAEGLRLQDVFTLPSPAETEQESVRLDIPRTEDEFNPGDMDSYLSVLDAAAGEDEWEGLLRSTEMLLAWMEPGDDGYGEVLWYRARAFEGLGHQDELLELARIYLGHSPDGDFRGWFLLRAARSATNRGNHRDAAQLWAMLAEEEARLDAGEAAEGARYLLRQGDPVSARRLTAPHANGTDAPPAGEAMEAVEVFLESLLVRDDPDLELPGGEIPLTEDTVRLHVRRAALMAVRGEQAEAEELAGTLLAGWTRRMVAPERELCEWIVRGPVEQYWPPNRSAARELDSAEDPSRTGDLPEGEGTRRQ